ncbi:MAG: hypothetical protein R3Y68_00660 [Rikenellaceae bacterium]
MKNKIFYSLGLTLGVALLASSCAKGDEFITDDVAQDQESVAGSVSQDQEVTIKVTLPATTRVGVDGLDVYWESGDKMMFYGSGSNFGTSATANTTSSTLSLQSLDGNSATFTGSLSATISGGQIAGIYPGVNAILNYGTSSAMSYSTLRILQPTYFQYTYTDGNLDPSAIGDYCFMHFVANQSEATSSSELTGEVNHLMSYIDFNLQNPRGAVDKVFIVLDTPITYPSMKVSMDGSCIMDSYVDYIIDTAGSTLDYATVNMNYFVVDLTDSATGELGVSANTDGIIPIRIPIIPQHLVGDANLFVQYSDGSEDVVSLKFPLTILAAGKVFNVDSAIDLSLSEKVETLPVGSATPKLGDFYYADGTYSNILDSTKDTPVGMVYELIGTGVNTKIANVFSTTIGYSTIVNTSTIGSVNDLTLVPNGAVSNYDGLLNVSMLAANARSHANAESWGITETSTIYEVCEVFYPAYSEALKKVSATDYSSGTDKGHITYTGDECGIWYLPSLMEGYRYAVDVDTMQGCRTLYYNLRLAELPTSITGLGSKVTPGYLAPISTTNGNYQHLTSTLNAASKYPYVRHRAFHYLDANSDNYIKSYSSNSYSPLQYRPIMKVNVE